MSQRHPYGDILKNKHDRAATCKITISAHPLMGERGKYLTISKQKGTALYVNRMY